MDLLKSRERLNKHERKGREGGSEVSTSIHLFSTLRPNTVIGLRRGFFFSPFLSPLSCYINDFTQFQRILFSCHYSINPQPNTVHPSLY